VRVAYFASAYPAASHTFIRREIEALRASGVEIDTFTLRRVPRAELRSEADLAAAEATWAVLPAPPLSLIAAHLAALVARPGRYLAALRASVTHRLAGARALVWSLFHFAEAIRLARELERRGHTHLHVHFSNAGAAVGRLAARYLDIPWSVTLHGNADFESPTRVLLGAKIAEACFSVCVSEFGRALALRLCAAKHAPRVHVVRCGLDLKLVPPQRAERAVGRARVLCVGRLSPEKGHVGLVEAFAALTRSGVDAELAVVGEGPERPRIEAAVARLALGDRVRLPGTASEDGVRAELGRADVFALSSFMEGLPVSMLEAMAQGVPVVVPRLAGIPEVALDGETALLYTPGCWDELAAGLARLIRDPALRERLGERARAKVEAEYEIGRAVQPLRALFARSENMGHERAGQS
jgi:glycosyltransferase involved in cell wall biosynthesis